LGSVRVVFVLRLPVTPPLSSEMLREGP